MMQKGSKNFKAKLREDQIMEIYLNQDQTQVELARLYGVSQPTINHIRKGRSWTHITKHGM